jgi:hypothetical protein
MPDLLVKLYDLPDPGPRFEELRRSGTLIRRAIAYEKHQVVDWVLQNFGLGWASECDVAFSQHPLSCHIATANSEIVGFACFDSTCKGFFGPLGVAESARHRGIGAALLLASLHAMAASGYAYAVIGGADSPVFYAGIVNCMEIPGSTPGIYTDRLKNNEAG